MFDECSGEIAIPKLRQVTFDVLKLQTNNLINYVFTARLPFSCMISVGENVY